MNVLRFYPQIRSSHFETEQIAIGLTIYLDEREDFDEEQSSRVGGTRRVSKFGAIRTLACSRVDVLELPEPLWLDVAFISAFAILGTRVYDLAANEHTKIVAYCIENAGLDRVPRSFLRLPEWAWRLPVMAWIGFCVMAFDALAFGSQGAFDAYISATPKFLRERLRRRSRIILQLPSLNVSSQNRPVLTRKAASVLFVGGFEVRKGFHLVLDAWPKIRSQFPGASLELVGHGPLESAAAELAANDSSVTVRVRPPRIEILDSFQRSQVCVLPSQPMSRWREQLGLPIVEAISFGCSVVATEETGLAGWLRSVDQSVLHVPSSSHDVAQAVVRHLQEWVDGLRPTYPLPRVAGRDQSEEWLLFGGDI